MYCAYWCALSFHIDFECEPEAQTWCVLVDELFECIVSAQRSFTIMHIARMNNGPSGAAHSTTAILENGDASRPLELTGATIGTAADGHCYEPLDGVSISLERKASDASAHASAWKDVDSRYTVQSKLFVYCIRVVWFALHINHLYIKTQYSCTLEHLLVLVLIT